MGNSENALTDDPTWIIDRMYNLIICCSGIES